MDTGKILLYAGGGFLLYKLFIAPKTAPIPTQPLPVYTNNPIVSTGSSNTGTLITAGVSTLATLLKNLISPGSAAVPVVSTGSQSSQQQATNDQIDDSVSSIFSNVTPIMVSNPANNNFGLPVAISLTDDDMD